MTETGLIHRATTGLAILVFAIEDGNEVAFRRGALVHFTSPKLLKHTPDD